MARTAGQWAGQRPAVSRCRLAARKRPRRIAAQKLPAQRRPILR